MSLQLLREEVNLGNFGTYFHVIFKTKIMEQRKLGTSELTVSPLCFGGNVFGWTADQETSFKLLDRFVNAGFNFIDTANSYSSWVPGNKGGESETIIGNWIKKNGKRDQVIIATKVGSEMNGEKGLSKNYIKRMVEQSLSRLQTDYIDLYQSHYDDLSTPIEETLQAYSELITEGKVRAIGASNFTPERLEQALQASTRGLPKYETLQPLYNLVERTLFETDLEPICKKHQVSVIPYYSLASGFLTGKYRSESDLNKSPRGQGVKKYLNEKGLAILAALDEIAAQYQATPAQVSLAWLISRDVVTSAIVSATSIEQLNDLTKAGQLELKKEDLERLNEVSR
ncbi:MAG: alcohol dehydrogenase [Sphingobacteriales bacterium]|nr:alcohol dehydrogenase [Sphingobacteriales bacterium]